jgi:hypothetical protein
MNVRCGFLLALLSRGVLDCPITNIGAAKAQIAKRIIKTRFMMHLVFIFF